MTLNYAQRPGKARRRYGREGWRRTKGRGRSCPALEGPGDNRYRGAMPCQAACEHLLAATADLITRHAPDFQTGSPVPWAQRTQHRSVAPEVLPVLRFLADCVSAAPARMRPLAEALASAAPGLAWRRSYSVQELGEHFYENYGWSELAGLTGPVPSTELACGFLVLGPRIEYPPHCHEARELYLPLAGRASWWTPGSGWHAVEPGTGIRHARWEPHAMRTAEEPLLALYVWRSDNLGQHASLVPER